MRSQYIYLNGIRLNNSVPKNVLCSEPFQSDVFPCGFCSTDAMFVEQESFRYVVWGKFGELVDGLYFVVADGVSRFLPCTGGQFAEKNVEVIGRVVFTEHLGAIDGRS